MTLVNTGSDDDFATWGKNRWLVLNRENNFWQPTSSPSSTRAEAERKRAQLLEHRLPGADLRIVRETTTYTLEPEP